MIKVKAAHVVQPPFDSDGTSFGRTIHFLSNENLSMHWKIQGTSLAGFALAIALGGVWAQPVLALLHLVAERAQPLRLHAPWRS